MTSDADLMADAPPHVLSMAIDKVGRHWAGIKSGQILKTLAVASVDNEMIGERHVRTYNFECFDEDGACFQFGVGVVANEAG